MVKKILIIALALALILGMGISALADGSLDAIRQKGYLILGLDDSFPPMGFRDEDNNIVGYDIDLAREVCARLGVELRLQPIDWAAKEMELSTGNIDCIWNGMSDTEERQASMACSLDYMNNAIVLMVKDDAYKTKEDLAGRVIGVQTGSFAEEVLNSEDYADYKAGLENVLSYTDYLTAIMDLQNGNVDAVAIDLVVANYRLAQMDDPSIRLIDNLADDLFCIGFRKDDVALRDMVNQTLIDMQKDGTVEKIAANWFADNISIIPAE